MDDQNCEGFSTITPEEAKAMMDGDVVILDVREPDEFASGHVPGAARRGSARPHPSRMPRS